MEESRVRAELSESHERDREQLSQFKKDLLRESQARQTAEKKARMYEKLVKGLVKDTVAGSSESPLFRDTLDDFSEPRNNHRTRSASSSSRPRAGESSEDRLERLSRRRERSSQGMKGLMKLAESGTVPSGSVLATMGLKGL